MHARDHSGSRFPPNGMRSPHGGLSDEILSHRNDSAGTPGGTRKNSPQPPEALPTRRSNARPSVRMSPHAGVGGPWHVPSLHAMSNTFRWMDAKVGSHGGKTVSWESSTTASRVRDVAPASERSRTSIPPAPP